MRDLCLVVGSVNVDMLARVQRFGERDEATATTDFTIAPGGHAANCAAALTRLGSQSRLLAATGDDWFGQIVCESLARTDVETRYVKTVAAAPTGVAIVLIVANGDRTMYLVPGANEHLTSDELMAAAIDASFVVVLDPPSRMLHPLAQIVADRPALFAPGGSTSAIADRCDAALMSRVGYVVVNAPESRRLTGEESADEAARALARRWNLCAVVTDGSDGCWIALDDELDHQASFAVDVVDTTGAGDAFIGGFVHTLMDGLSPWEAARHGCAVGALATRAVGAQAALPTSDESEALCANSVVERAVG